MRYLRNRAYAFFAKCPHRRACARCSFYLPKDSHHGQLLSVREGIDRTLEHLDLTEDERHALEGDRQAVVRLVDRLAEVSAPAGSTPQELGAERAVISLTDLRMSIAGGES